MCILTQDNLQQRLYIVIFPVRESLITFEPQSMLDLLIGHLVDIVLHSSLAVKISGWILAIDAAIHGSCELLLPVFVIANPVRWL